MNYLKPMWQRALGPSAYTWGRQWLTEYLSIDLDADDNPKNPDNALVDPTSRHQAPRPAPWRRMDCQKDDEKETSLSPGDNMS